MARSFVDDVRAAFGSYDDSRRARGIPESEVEVLLTDEFVTAVGGMQGEPYTTDRVGGTAWAKTVDRDGDVARPLFVCDARVWNDLRAIYPVVGGVRIVPPILQQLGHLLVRRAPGQWGIARQLPIESEQAEPKRPLDST